MAIDETDVVDAIGVDGVSGQLVMTIADHLDWKEVQLHLEALRDKFNAYLRAVQDGDLVNSYPDAEGRRVVIELVGGIEPALWTRPEHIVSNGGWPMILSGLKTYVETGEELTTPGSLMYANA